MVRYAVRATDTMYCGMHGIVDTAVVHDDPQDAYDTGVCMASDLFDQYSCLREEIDSIYDSDMDEEEKNAEVGMYIDEHSQVEVYRIKEDCTFSDEEIEDMLFQDFEEFIKLYCDKEDIY